MKTPPVLSREGAEFIGAFEGFRDVPYNDAGDNATIGFGHLLHYGPVTDTDRRKWGSITRAQAARLLQHDARVALMAVERYVHVALDHAQVDALCSFAYNCGADALSPAHNVYAAVNTKPLLWLPARARRTWYQGIAAALLEWDHVGDQVEPGLERRRRAEAWLFATSIYTRPHNPYANA